MRTLGSLFALVLVAGCYPSMRVAKRTAAEDFECSSDLTVRRRGDDVFSISGCGRTGIYQCPTGPGVSSRYCVNLMLLAERRAEAEFDCRDNSVREVSPSVFLVEGCGVRSTYRCEAAGSQAQCVREPDAVEPAAAASPDAAPSSAAAPQ